LKVNDCGVSRQKASAACTCTGWSLPASGVCSMGLPLPGGSVASTPPVAWAIPSLRV
jgi:hypothetical protein